MRFKDFGQPEIFRLSSGLITVSTTIPSESEYVRTLERENWDFLNPWKIQMNTDKSETKIFTVSYDKQIVGQIVLWNFQTNDGLKSCSISYWIAEKFSNKGITTEAVNLVLQHAFYDLGVDEVDATVQPENSPSIRLIEKLKFSHRTTIGDPKIFRGRWQNYTVYTMTKEPNANVSV